MTAKAVQEILQEYFPLRLQSFFEPLPGQRLDRITEIRCRVGQPLQVIYGDCNRLTFAEGVLQPQELQYMLMRMNQGSLYAWEEEYRRGYLTLPGGHRVGMAGKAVLEQGYVKTMINISALNFRIAQEISGAADLLLPQIVEEGRVLNTLIVSPPGCGKTTMLRDAIRQLSQGIPALGVEGLTISVVDERSELAGTVNGIAQLDLGSSTDILDGCPKSEGMRMMIRSMAPAVLATDEIGTRADVEALEEALQAGVAVMVTAHGKSLADVGHHGQLKRLLDNGLLQRIVILERRRKIGAIQQIYGYEKGTYQPMMG